LSTIAAFCPRRRARSQRWPWLSDFVFFIVSFHCHPSSALAMPRRHIGICGVWLLRLTNAIFRLVA
jgi:hypothetical protein